MSALEPLTNQAERLEWLPDGMTWRSTWNVATQYVKNDVVISAATGAAYVANINILGGADPANVAAPSPWTLLGSGSALSNTSLDQVTGDSGGGYNLATYPAFTFVQSRAGVPLVQTLTAAQLAASQLLVIVQGFQIAGGGAFTGICGCGPNNLGQGATDVPFPAVGSPYYIDTTQPTGLPLLNVQALGGLSQLWVTQYFSLCGNIIADNAQGVTYNPTMVFLLKKGVDYNDATTSLQFGYANIQGATIGQTFQKTLSSVIVVPIA